MVIFRSEVDVLELGIFSGPPNSEWFMTAHFGLVIAIKPTYLIKVDSSEPMTGWLVQIEAFVLFFLLRLHLFQEEWNSIRPK